MITGKTRDHIINQLEKSDFQFHLTGSRAMGNWHSESDWDYFTEDNPDVRAFLEKLGFGEDSEASYDTSTVVYALGHYHVQLVSNFGNRFKAQNMVLNNLYLVRVLHALSKKDAKNFWYAMLELIN